MPELAYTQGHNASVYLSHESRKAADTCGYFLSSLEPDSIVLDAGCGPGTVTSSLATLIPAGQVVGVDAVETAVNKARAQPSLPSNCTFDVADVTALPYEDNHFDVVYTSQILAHIPEAVEAIVELRRVCKPGGFVALREGDLPATIIHPSIQALKQWQAIKIDVGLQSRCHPSAGRMLLGWALEAGFTESQIDYTVGSLTYSGDQRQFWGNAMAERIFLSDGIWREHATGMGVSEAEFDAMHQGWLAFAADPAAVFSMPCGQVICREH
jgi:SAM-dependent methyltransferase